MGGHLWDSLQAVLVLQFVQFIGSSKKFFSDCKCFQLKLKEQLDKLTVTNQVTATRQNSQEWRSCLQFAAQWHGCKLQSVYALWQSSSLRSPPPPVSQKFRLQSGMPLSPIDQYLSNKEVTDAQSKLNQYDSPIDQFLSNKEVTDAQSKLNQYNYKLGVAAENLQLIKECKSNLSVASRSFLHQQVVPVVAALCSGFAVDSQWVAGNAL